MSGIRQDEPVEPSVASGEFESKQLHFTTLWVPLLESLPGLAVTGLVGSMFVGLATVLLVGLWFVLLPIAASNLIRYFSFRYQLRDSELLIRSGIFWRHERRIPLEKVQDVRIRRGPFHQVFAVLRLEITTAASEEREAVLDTISTQEADRIQQAVAMFRQRQLPVSDSRSQEAGYVLRMTLRELFLGALSSRVISTVFAIVGVVLYFQLSVVMAGELFEPWDMDMTEWWERWVLPDNRLVQLALSILNLDDTLAGALALIVGGLVLFLGRFAIRHSRFRLTRVGEVISLSQGLFSVNSAAFDRERIQALKVEEPLLRRWMGLATVWVDSGGDRVRVDDVKKRDPLVPIVRREKIPELLRQTLGLQNPEPRMKRVSPKAVMRGCRVGWAVLLLMMLLNGISFGLLSLTLVPLFPLVYLLNVRWYRNRGYWIGCDYLVSRQGWFTRQTLYLPIKNVQNLSLSQSPFDRRLGLATLAVDTAGQSNTGGGPAIRNLPAREAREIQVELSRRIAGSWREGDDTYNPG